MSSPIPSSSTSTLDLTSTPPSSLSVEQSLDDYFEYNLSEWQTHESQYDLSDTEALPPYVEDLPPTYALKAPEPLTLALYLFKFGFLFPPFWIMGAWILLSPLRAPSNEIDAEDGWMADKTEAERARIIEEMRKTESRWAKRCLWALITFILVCLIAGVTAWAVVRS
ncbi:hypothetical protein C0991_010402 [Blastosporella zonata]|nr:hypothetical protein C0991_010402 [Blastosporella zonata]